MQFHSFDTRDPLFEFGPWRLSFQVITLENTYGLNLERTTITPGGDGWRLVCTELSWAGQQRRAPGGLVATIRREGDALRLSIMADAAATIRCVKVLVRDLPSLRALDLLDRPEPVPNTGTLLRYPNHLRLPLLFVEHDGGVIGMRCEDAQGRAKRFAIYAERFGPLAGRCAVELIFEDDARFFASHVEAPDWVISPAPDLDAFRAAQLAFTEAQMGLVPWEQRIDMPGWARRISLVMTIHCMHWTGYTFNTYNDARAVLRYVTDRLPGEQVLALLAGWEGRYYWQYSDYRPEPLLGGADSFAQLAGEARDRGAHLMPFFGVTSANAWTTPGFERFGPVSHMKSPTRTTYVGNRPDWDISRGRDTTWQAWLNIGAPAWRAELSRQILATLDGYDLDAVFLDCPEVWTNDPDYNLREGLHALVHDLRAAHPGLLVAGEDWWDGILDVLPLCQTTRKWRPVPAWAGRYGRFFEHIADSEPGRGSTGVFESGFAPYEPLPSEPYYIPTIAFVDGTLAVAPDAVDAAIERARRYAERNLAS
ncbi:MAG: hypothetical protein IT325_00420 [Anaerolineae bacterium]|nr:hypothetical protein [Anaerolineae bacterium]